MTFDRCDLGGLVVHGIKSMHVAEDDLQWHQCGQQPQRHRQHSAAFLDSASPPQMMGRNRTTTKPVVTTKATTT